MTLKIIATVMTGFCHRKLHTSCPGRMGSINYRCECRCHGSVAMRFNKLGRQKKNRLLSKLGIAKKSKRHKR